MEENHIQTVINLSDTMNILQTFFKGSNPDVSYYYRTLLWKGRVYTADLHLTDNKNVFRKKVVKSLQFIANHNGPYLVHCRVGRDRTGIVILVLESLTGAPYSYILNDYAVSYINIDGFSREKAVQKAKSKIDIHFQELTGKSKKTNWGKLNLAPYTERWLKKGGMTANEISTLKKRLSVSYSK